MNWGDKGKPKIPPCKIRKTPKGKSKSHRDTGCSRILLPRVCGIVPHSGKATNCKENHGETDPAIREASQGHASQGRRNGSLTFLEIPNLPEREPPGNTRNYKKTIREKRKTMNPSLKTKKHLRDQEETGTKNLVRRKKDWTPGFPASDVRELHKQWKKITGTCFRNEEPSSTSDPRIKSVRFHRAGDPVGIKKLGIGGAQ